MSTPLCLSDTLKSTPFSNPFKKMVLFLGISINRYWLFTPQRRFLQFHDFKEEICSKVFHDCLIHPHSDKIWLWKTENILKKFVKLPFVKEVKSDLKTYLHLA